MLRSFFLLLSRNRSFRRYFETSRSAASLTKRFVAGNTLAEGMQVNGQLAERGIFVALDHLGENVSSESEAALAAKEIVAALDHIAKAGTNTTVAIKLTQFGLDLGDDICRHHLRPVFTLASAIGTRVEIDMESTVYTERTIGIVKEMHAEFGCVRAVLQAYLYRTEQDLAELNHLGVPIRLCKGAYQESSEVAYPSKADVDANFVKLMETLLREGTYPAIASHDERILTHALAYSKELKLASDRYEFQMLYGIRRQWQQRLVDQGQRLRLYVPYGEAWYPYFMRRLAERPANVVFLATNMLES